MQNPGELRDLDVVAQAIRLDCDHRHLGMHLVRGSTLYPETLIVQCGVPELAKRLVLDDGRLAGIP